MGSRVQTENKRQNAKREGITHKDGRLNDTVGLLFYTYSSFSMDLGFQSDIVCVTLSRNNHHAIEEITATLVPLFLVRCSLFLQTFSTTQSLTNSADPLTCFSLPPFLGPSSMFNKNKKYFRIRKIILRFVGIIHAFKQFHLYFLKTFYLNFEDPGRKIKIPI